MVYTYPALNTIYNLSGQILLEKQVPVAEAMAVFTCPLDLLERPGSEHTALHVGHRSDTASHDDAHKDNNTSEIKYRHEVTMAGPMLIKQCTDTISKQLHIANNPAAIAYP